MRWLLLYFLLPLVLLGLLWSGFWWWSAGKLRDQLERWQAVQAEQGRKVSFRAVRVEGFPARLRLHLADPEVADRSGWLWEGPTITGEASLWQPRRIHLSFPGTQRLEPPPGSPLAPLELATGDAEGDAVLARDGSLDSFRLRFDGVALAGYVNGGTRAESLELGWGGEARSADGSGAEDFPFLLRIEGLEMPSAIEPPLGRNLERLVATGRVEGRPRIGPPAVTLPEWADAGGVVELETLEVVWGPLRLEGDASLSLDPQNRPLGAGTARILGFERSLDAFVEGGLVEEEVAGAVRFGLLALSGRDENGQRVIEVPLSAQDGVLLIGPLPLLPLPALF